MENHTQTIEAIEAELLNSPMTASIEEHEALLKRKSSKTVKSIVSESPETPATITKPAKTVLEPLGPLAGSFSIVFAAESFTEGLNTLLNGTAPTEDTEAIAPQIESCNNITEITTDSTEYETLMKYGSNKWFSIMESRLHNLTPDSAEGFQIVGKAARRAKADLGLKGKKGLKIYFVHGINK